jgi:hypothetical protein
MNRKPGEMAHTVRNMKIVDGPKNHIVHDRIVKIAVSMQLSLVLSSK